VDVAIVGTKAKAAKEATATAERTASKQEEEETKVSIFPKKAR
jgi:hypothetical protein